MLDMTRLEKIEQDVLSCGHWGTIGPHAMTVAAALAERTGARYGLFCHSADGAYEALLRTFGAQLAACPKGDVTVTGEVSTPQNSLIALCVGSTPVFCPVCEGCGMITPDALLAALDAATLPVRAVVVDYLAERECADSDMLQRVSALCREKGVALVINAGGSIGATYEGKPLTAYADAVVYTLGQGSAIDVGMGGLVITDREEIYAGVFAYHNCGRSLGDGCSLNMDEIVGGDLRASEWIAAAAAEILAQNALATPAPRTLVKMKGQPVFESDFAKKQTGI